MILDLTTQLALCRPCHEVCCHHELLAPPSKPSARAVLLQSYCTQCGAYPHSAVLLPKSDAHAAVALAPLSLLVYFCRLNQGGCCQHNPEDYALPEHHTHTPSSVHTAAKECLPLDLQSTAPRSRCPASTEPPRFETQQSQKQGSTKESRAGRLAGAAAAAEGASYCHCNRWVSLQHHLRCIESTMLQCTWL